MKKYPINTINEEDCNSVNEVDLKDDYSRKKRDNSSYEEIENNYSEINGIFKENSNSDDLNHTLEEKPEELNNNAEDKQDEEPKNGCETNPVKKININIPQQPPQNNQQSPQKENLANRGQIEENLKEALINLMNKDSNTDNKKDFEYPFQNTEKNLSKKKTGLLSEHKFNKKNNNKQQLDTKIIKNDKQTTYKIKEEIGTENKNITINEPMNNVSEVNNLVNNLNDYNNILPSNGGDPNENDKNKEFISELKTGKGANITVYNEINLPIENELARIMGDFYNGNFYPYSEYYYSRFNYDVISNNVKEIRVPKVSLGIITLKSNNNIIECVKENPNG